MIYLLSKKNNKSCSLLLSTIFLLPNKFTFNVSNTVGEIRNGILYLYNEASI